MDKKNHPIFRRRNYFIKKGLQGRFILLFCFIVLLGFVLNLTVAYILIDRELARTLYSVHLKIHSSSAIIMPILMSLGAATVPFIVIASVAAGFYLTRTAERRLHSFGNFVRMVSLGDLFRGRPEDITGELEEALSGTIGSLEAGWRSLKKRAVELEMASERLASAIGTGGDELNSALDDMSGSIKITSQEMAKFRV